jgi:2'-hydroxyisoflavone reductase
MDAFDSLPAHAARGFSRRGLLASTLAPGFGLSSAAAPRRILILGGTGFLGPATVEAAGARGHRLTLFNRGRTRPGLFPDIEKLQGDRDPDKGEGLKALAGRKWDAVIDNSGYYPRMVSASARLLAPNVKQYIFISTESVYAENRREGLDETDKLATMPDPTSESMGTNFEYYGALKALCERAAEDAMPGRVAVVRPGYIVGPDDPTGRFTYWPVRVDRGGEVLAPGEPGDPVQFIDVRDLGAWLIGLVERSTTGIFNAVGPAERLTMGSFLEACQKATPEKSTLTWVSADFLEQQKLDLPIWAPYRGDTKGFHTRSAARAMGAGLRFRPYAATIKDTLAWYKTQKEGGRTRLAGPTAEQEAATLAAWRKREAKG